MVPVGQLAHHAIQHGKLALTEPAHVAFDITKLPLKLPHDCGHQSTAERSVVESFASVRSKFVQGSSVEAAFDYLLAYAKAASFNPIIRSSAIDAVEFQWPDRKLKPYAVIAQANHLTVYLRRPILNVHEGLYEDAIAKFGVVKPNRLGEYRTHLKSVDDVEAMLSFLRKQGAWPSKRTDLRFASDAFNGVTGEHLLRAAQRLAAGFTDHPFGPSTDYDLLFDGHRLPPKAVFGLAASEALKFQVKPANFSAGDNLLCFRMLLKVAIGL